MAARRARRGSETSNGQWIAEVLFIELKRPIAAYHRTNPFELLDRNVDAILAQPTEGHFHTFTEDKTSQAGEIIARGIEERSKWAGGVRKDRPLNRV